MTRLFGFRQSHQSSVERRPGLAKPDSALCFEIGFLHFLILNRRAVFPHVLAASQGSV
jgi:hypothetical protein